MPGRDKIVAAAISAAALILSYAGLMHYAALIHYAGLGTALSSPMTIRVRTLHQSSRHCSAGVMPGNGKIVRQMREI